MGSDWGPNELKEYVDSHLAAVQAEILLRVTELHREHDKFELMVRDGFVKQNEFRGALEDLGRTMATRREMESAEETLGSRMGTLFDQALVERERLEERINKSDRWQSRLGGGLLLIGLLFPAVAATLSALLVYFITRG